MYRKEIDDLEWWWVGTPTTKRNAAFFIWRCVNNFLLNDEYKQDIFEKNI